MMNPISAGKFGKSLRSDHCGKNDFDLEFGALTGAVLGHDVRYELLESSEAMPFGAFSKNRTTGETFGRQTLDCRTAGSRPV